MATTYVPVTFRFPGRLAPTARHVAVVGSFNNWNSLSHPMVQNSAGDWTATVFLPPGRTFYGFWVDGMMWLDPADEGREPNAWGSECSVRNVDPAPKSASLMGATAG